MKQGKKAKQCTWRHEWTSCHLKNSELDPTFEKYKGRVVLRGDIVKDDSGSYAVFTEQGSSASQNDGRKSNGCYCKVTRMRRTSSRCSINLHAGQYGRCTIIVQKIPKSECPDIWIRLPKHSEIMVQHGRPSRSS